MLPDFKQLFAPVENVAPTGKQKLWNNKTLFSDFVKILFKIIQRKDEETVLRLILSRLHHHKLIRSWNHHNSAKQPTVLTLIFNFNVVERGSNAVDDDWGSRSHLQIVRESSTHCSPGMKSHWRSFCAHFHSLSSLTSETQEHTHTHALTPKHTHTQSLSLT